MPPGPVLRRRTALLGATMTALVAGCDHGDDIGEPTTSSGPTAGSTSPSASAAALSPDEALVAAVVSQLTYTLSVLTTSRQVPALRPSLVPAIRAHRRHLEVLEGDLGVGSPGARPGPAAALRAARDAEQELHGVLVDGAGRAESGALAKLLASMSAATTQLLATFPTGPER